MGKDVDSIQLDIGQLEYILNISKQLNKTMIDFSQLKNLSSFFCYQIQYKNKHKT